MASKNEIIYFGANVPIVKQVTNVMFLSYIFAVSIFYHVYTRINVKYNGILLVDDLQNIVPKQ